LFSGLPISYFADISDGLPAGTHTFGLHAETGSSMQQRTVGRIRLRSLLNWVAAIPTMPASMELKVEKNVRVLLMHNFLSPYRIPLFTELASRFDLDVWILGDIKSVRDWPDNIHETGFRRRTLPHITIPLGSAYNVILINYTLAAELKRHRHDVVVCCAWDTPATFHAALHARRTKTPFVLWSGSTSAENTLLRAVSKPLVKWLVQSASAWIAYGTQARDYLVSLGARPDRTFLAFNTVETATFAELADAARPMRRELREQHGVSAPRVILYSGNLLDLKGVGDLIEAFARYYERDPGCTLVLVGSGKHRRKYEARVAQLGIGNAVVFAGFVQRDRLPAYYAMADLLAVPSRTDVWGLVINEALACGLPVAASNAAGATADLIRDGENGYVLPSRNPSAWCECFVRHFADVAAGRDMSAAARTSIQPFSIEHAADAFVDAVRCAIGSARA